MAGLMTAAMVIIELALMGAMYHNKRLNAPIIAASIVVLIAFGFCLDSKRPFRISNSCGR